jgi:very-short-patch-repair endonuclease
VQRGVYAVGRPEIDQLGRWMAAVLCCGPAALLGHRSAAELWGLAALAARPIEVVVPTRVVRRRPGIRVRRQGDAASSRHIRRRIPVTDLVTTLLDLATELGDDEVEAAINTADRNGLIDPERLRRAIGGRAPRPGLRRLRATLDRRTFTPTDSYLERKLLTLIRDAHLPVPETQAWVNGFRVDFYWPDLGLVVETDGLRYHRTAAQQERDLRRDQAHSTAGLETLRFSAAQVRDDPTGVQATLAAVIKRRRLKPFGTWGD